MTSHRPGWRNGRHFGVAANDPLTVVYNPHQSSLPFLPEQRSFFSVSAENVALSTMKRCEDDDNVVVRLFENAGKDISARFRFVTSLQSAQSTNIIEEEGKPTIFKQDEVPISLTHWSIQTFKFVVKK